jgi:hypothetical protein
MPMTPVTVRRWEVIVAFAAITVAFIIGLTLLHRADRKIERVIHQTSSLAKANQRQIVIINRFRRDRAIVVTRTTKALCVQNHRLVTILREFLKEGSEEFQLRPAVGQDIVQFGRRVTLQLKRADCTPSKLPSNKFVPKKP